MMRSVLIDYTNWRGVRRKRVIIPQHTFWGHTTYHPEDQWLLTAVDTEDMVAKQFAMSGIHAWENYNG